MSRPCSALFTGFVLLALAAAASAQDVPDSRVGPNRSPKTLDQVIYKGLVGSVLDAVPMDPLKRVDLQRTNAVISNTLSARSLAAVAGFSNPALMIGGLLWGVWAASNINPEAANMNVTAIPVNSGGRIEAQAGIAVLSDSSPAVTDPPAKPAPEPRPLGTISVVDSGVPAYSHPPVIRIWLPQRAF